MGGGSKGSNTTTSTKVELPKWYEPMAQNAATAGYNQLQQPFAAYPGQRIAGLAPEQQLGLTMTSQQALNNPVTQAQRQQTVDTLSGAYLDPTKNPAFQPTMDRLASAYRTGTSANTNAAFSKAGALGMDNSAYNQYTQMNNTAFADSLAKAAGDIYNTERKNQLIALQLAPGANAAQYNDLQSLIGVGDAYRQFEQDNLNLGYENFLEQREYPWTQLGKFANLAPALLGNSGTSTAIGPNPYRASPIAGAIGGGISGAALGSMIPAIASTGYGIPIAAALGALGGGFLS